MFVLYFVPVYPAMFLIYLISATVVLLVYLALMIQFSLLYNKAGRPVHCVVLFLFSLTFSVV